MSDCTYCGATDLDDAEGIAVLPIDDDAGWSTLAIDHAPHCEWIETRAHRIGVHYATATDSATGTKREELGPFGQIEDAEDAIDELRERWGSSCTTFRLRSPIP